MEINLNKLRVFYLTVREKSITKAAEKLFVTQPAVTMQIKSLEEGLGIKLFRKRGNVIELTEAGKDLYSYAEKIFDIVRKMEGRMARYSDVSGGCLVIGTTRSFARHLMPDVLSNFQEQFPNVKISLRVGSSKAIADDLLEFKYDLGIIGELPYGSKLKTINYTKEEFRLVTSNDHRFVGRRSVSLKELENEPIIIREEGASSRHLILSLLHDHNVSPSVLIEAGSVEFIKKYVIMGRGVSFLYVSEIRREIEKGLLRDIPLKEGPILLQTVIAFPRDAGLSPAAEAFLRLTECTY
ncbi:MAG: LysR family transcriptional regulator [Deltaproteobacteria bacterium]|nr:LysR family transcriptional regulator [Deltaproteobacteria bacterium]MBW1929239.1 LysR family transcriptional regulator [Deltaproteobacteria bacterium]MBW2027053.1 LysR family transcriptional regulator [Deltaproteobacteria bacterium]MBW2127474.1 LysR family transcriptional regulator [Deltaproteobacteria bacterium]